jgi:anti-sigma regulatory factor (Ser/Thr protein kinase)
MLERRFVRDFASLEAIYSFVREFMRDRSVDEEHAWELDVVVEELFTNMVKYGTGSEPILIALDWAPPELTLRLRDFGSTVFDPTQVPEVDTSRPIGERHAGGLGIHLVRQIADRFEFSRGDREATITVTKRLNP